MKTIPPIVLCAALLAGGAAQAQPITGLPLQGSSRDYMVLRQPQAPARVTLFVRPVSGQAIHSEVERWDPGTNQLRDALSINWSAQASCQNGLSRVTISGPGGSQVQQFPLGQPSISGRTRYQSFEVDAVDDVCIAWAEEIVADCGWPLEPTSECPDDVMFVFGRDDPLPDSAPVVVGGNCTDGPLPQRTYVPRLELTCLLDN